MTKCPVKDATEARRAPNKQNVVAFFGAVTRPNMHYVPNKNYEVSFISNRQSTGLLKFGGCEYAPLRQISLVLPVRCQIQNLSLARACLAKPVFFPCRP
jgi:hypothetical protein